MILQIKFQRYFGTYTAQSYGESSNSNIKYEKSSSSMSLISRKLLTPDEVMKIENPYAIIIVFDKLPVIANVPDISLMHFNKLNGMGTKEENQKLRIQREQARKERPITPIKIWNIWDKKTKDVISDVELIQNKFQKSIKGER